jgi:two-component system, NarL family, nitrate/nitrite response regulator NarL
MSATGHSVFVCESLPIVVEGLRKVLDNCPDLELVGVATSAIEALPLVEAERPHLILVDDSAGLRATLQFVTEVRRSLPESRFVLWANLMAEVDSMRALQAGVRGFLKRTTAIDTLVGCLRAVAEGNLWVENSISNQVGGGFNRKTAPRLTAREQEIVQLVCRGLKNRQIAQELSITPGTVKVHLMHVFEKTGVRDRYELALRGRKAAESGVSALAAAQREVVDG